MRRRAVLLLLIAAAVACAAAAAPIASAAAIAERLFMWSPPVYTPGSVGETSFESLAKGPAGSIYVSGDLNRMPSGIPGGGSKLLVARVDGETGAKVWATSTSGPGHLGVVHAATAPDGRRGVVAVGICATRGGDGYVARFGAGGKLLWSRRFCGDGRDNIYVAGSVTNRRSGKDAVILKYSPDGVLRWRSTVKSRGVADDWFVSLTVDPSRNVYATGTRAATATYSQLVTVAVRPGGHLIWRKYIDLSGTLTTGVKVVVRATGDAAGVYVAGTRANGDADNPLWPRLQKYTLAGEPQWTGVLPTKISDLAGMAVDAGGRMVLVGSQYNTTYDHTCGLILFTRADGAEGSHYQWSNGQTGTDGGLPAGLARVILDADGRAYASGWMATTTDGSTTDAIVATYPPVDAAAEEFDGLWSYSDAAHPGPSYRFTPLLMMGGQVYVAGRGDRAGTVVQGIVEKLDLTPIL